MDIVSSNQEKLGRILKTGVSVIKTSCHRNQYGSGAKTGIRIGVAFLTSL